MTVDPADLFPIDLGDPPPELAEPGALGAAITEHHDPEAPGYAYRITDDGEAEWAAGKLAAARAIVEAKQAEHGEYLRRLKIWLADATTAASREADYFEALLANYALEQRQAGRKSVPLPSARLQTRAEKPRAVIVDPEAVMLWALEHHPDLVHPKPVLVSELRDVVQVVGELVVDGTGQSVPGVAVETPDPSVTVTT